MLYLVSRYDKDYKISYPPGTREYYQMNNWLFFQNAGVGPMQGQASMYGFCFNCEKKRLDTFLVSKLLRILHVCCMRFHGSPFCNISKFPRLICNVPFCCFILDIPTRATRFPAPCEACCSSEFRLFRTLLFVGQNTR